MGKEIWYGSIILGVMDGKLCAAYNADENYAGYMGISMLSLFENNRDFEEIDVFIMECGISDASKEKLLRTSDIYGRRVFFVSMKNIISDNKLNKAAKNFSAAAYGRLFLASAIPGTYEKVLYLDCDTIILGNLKKLWNTDLKNYSAAGVMDTVARYNITRTGLSQNDPYVNAGVLLVNLAKWREEGIENKFLDFMEKFHYEVPFYDQGAINGICGKNLLVLPPWYNVISNMFTFSAEAIRKIYLLDCYYPNEELNVARKNPVIIHYTTGLVGRPWEKNCTHPRKEEFLKFKNLSLWKDEPLLPDSRKFTLKAFTSLHRHMPELTENIYRMGNRIKETAHIRTF